MNEIAKYSGKIFFFERKKRGSGGTRNICFVDMKRRGDVHNPKFSTKLAFGGFFLPNCLIFFFSFSKKLIRFESPV
jgi:hypothetical protein